MRYGAEKVVVLYGHAIFYLYYYGIDNVDGDDVGVQLLPRVSVKGPRRAVLSWLLLEGEFTHTLTYPLQTELLL